MVVRTLSKYSEETFRRRWFKKQISLLLVSKKDHLSTITNLIRHIEGNICYVTTGKPYHTLVNTLNKNKVNTEKIFFIDYSKKNGGRQKNCIAVSGLGTLSKYLSTTLNKQRPNLLVFDNITDLAKNFNALNFTRFVQSMILKPVLANTLAIFVCIDEDINEDLFRDLQMFVDQVIEWKKKYKDG